MQGRVIVSLVDGVVVVSSDYCVVDGDDVVVSSDYCHPGCANNWIADKYCDQVWLI